MKKKLLMHVCSAENAETAVKNLHQNYSLGLYFYNPNIAPRQKYQQFANDIHELARQKKIPEFKARYDPKRLAETIRGWEKDDVLLSRCAACLFDRMQQTARIARLHGFDSIATSIHPVKNMDSSSFYKILQLVAEEHGLQFVPINLKELNQSAAAVCNMCTFMEEE